MTTKISPREWEAISAYLDGQLAPHERTRLEARLEQDRELSLALEEMRRVRVMLRSQPKLRAPRNFTLTPQMVGKVNKRPAPRAYFGLSLASALATVLLVLVLIGDFFTGAPTVETALNYPLNTPTYSEAAETLKAAPPGMEDVASQAERAMTAPGGAASEEPGVSALSQATEDPASEPPSIAAAPQTGPEEAVEAPPAEEQEMETFMAEDQAPGAEAVPAPSPVRNPLGGLDQQTVRVIEVLLALVAVGAGLAAIYLRRARSG